MVDLSGGKNGLPWAVFWSILFFVLYHGVSTTVKEDQRVWTRQASFGPNPAVLTKMKEDQCIWTRQALFGLNPFRFAPTFWRHTIHTSGPIIHPLFMI